MVTSNIISDKKVVKMDNSNVAVVPQRTLLGEVNEHITCPLCRGYYIDATTIVECLHSFCRSCIIKHLKAKSYCPVCEMMINSAKPNIKLDKALQDIVYKLVPGLFQKEMERRQHFYASRPGQAATATPEQRGEDTERIIFSPEDVISFSLEYADVTDTDSISSKSSDSNEPPPNSASTRRYLQCPAVVNISHLKKFLSKKFDVDSSQFAIDILYKKVPLPDYYTLMDIAYIYNWKRNEPMRFFYQIIDYVAIRNRIFDINRKRSHFHDQKLSPVSTEDTSTSSPAPNLHDHASEASSGPSSPVPDDNNRNTPEVLTNDKMNVQNDESCNDKNDYSSTNKLDEDVEKSQFLNSFELTAKSSCIPVKSPQKFNTEKLSLAKEVVTKSITSKVKAEDPTPDNLKRKNHTSPPTPELKKLKVEISNCLPSFSVQPSSSSISTKTEENQRKHETVDCNKNNQSAIKNNAPSATPTTRDLKQPQTVKQQVGTSKQTLDNSGVKRTVVGPQNILSPKRKPPNESTAEQAMPQQQQQQKTLSPLKLQIPKLDAVSKTSEAPKPPLKKIPDLKPSMPMLQSAHSKSPAMNKVRMDLLANNSDPTIDRSKILSQVKSSMGVQSPAQNSGDPLKSLFDSCKINIPSSLSITLTDQKSDNRCPVDTLDPKKNFTNKNLAAASSSSISAHKVPSPPVHNYIEILKLPESDSNLKKIAKNEADSKTNSQCKPEISQTKPTTKGSETSTKGPVPNLKPIADTKLAKQAGNFSTPITFQQTFEQQLQSLQCDKKGKPKNKAQVPKLVPATPKSLSAVTKPIIPVNKPTNSSSTETKTGTALDLTTPHNIQSQLAVQQTFDKALETMHSIANLAKKQNLPSKGIPMSLTHSNIFPGITSRPLTAGINSVRLSSPNTINQVKLDKPNPNVPTVTGNNRQESSIKSSQVKQLGNMNLTLQSPAYQIPSAHPPSNAQPSPRSQTRSPSSSPKLVIAEEKQTSTTVMEHNVSQLNQVTSTHITNFGTPKGELSKTLPGPSKPSLKQVKNLNTNKMSVQATIPFKHRKRTCFNNDENNDLSNINYVPKERTLKRSLRDRKIKIDDDDSSKVKKSKSSKNTTDDRAAEVCSSLNDESPKILKPLTSREMEIERLENFLNEHLENEESASIYVSGQPGTGKTASLSYILQQPKIKEGFKQVYINCTMMKSAASIYSRVCKELGLKMTATTEKACVKAIEKYLQKTHKMILLVLDELDQLDSKRQSVLYSIFEWPVLPNSRIVLIGVANALDLTERTLPRLQARCSLKPHTLHFAPYTKEQIIKIFVAVLANDDKANVFSPVALQMLAAKIAAVSGDMRRALDIGRRVIEVANRNRFAENKSVDSLLRDSSVTVELKEVLQVLNNVYGGSTNIGSEVDEGLPMQQKLILCSLILMLNKGKNTDILMGKLHEVYKKVAASRNIAALGLSELCGACSLLEARGAVRVCAGAGRARRLRLHWDLPELQAALADKPLLAEILRHAA